MAQKIKRDPQAIEDEELEAFVAARAARRNSLIKRIVIIIVCIGLVLCFCLPAVSMLI